MNNTNTKQPTIGIVMQTDEPSKSDYAKPGYAKAILEEGGLPLFIPLIPNRNYIHELVTQHLDGILLTGNDSDIDPVYYGQAPHIKLGAVCSSRDETDQLLLTEAEKYKLPVLGICFGMQSINVYRNGTLLQDLPSQVETCIQHSQHGDSIRLSHSIKIQEESILATLAGSLKKRVNSTHHQAVDKMGQDLQPIAWSVDGVIEAIINTCPDQFMIGIQWHPEVSYAVDEFSRSIFKYFIEQSTKTIKKTAQRN